MMPMSNIEETGVNAKSVHEPVLLREVVDLLAVASGATIVDATLGLIAVLFNLVAGRCHILCAKQQQRTKAQQCPQYTASTKFQ